MDALLKRFDAVTEGDLTLVPRLGVAYQTDMRVKVRYDEAYFQKYVGYEETPISLEINKGRAQLVEKYVGYGRCLDIGIGSGEFCQKRNLLGGETCGYDINPAAREWLEERDWWSEDFDMFEAFSFWDVVEHIELPDNYFKKIRPGSFVFVSIPIFTSLDVIRKSRHYRPGEHLYYFTQDGFVKYMEFYGFRLLEVQDFEIEAGRDSIYTFSFVRDLPGYSETVAQYSELHSNFYGASAGLYLGQIAEQVQDLKPMSILDYGCGRSDLVAHFWRDGKRRIARYDPAIVEYKAMPAGRFDLCLCTDVMEHVPIGSVDRVLSEIKDKSDNALFTISMRPARQKLPDGRNAHVTLLTESEWSRWIQSVFGRATKIKTKWDHILMARTF
jgi:2-polyprenyl-3-methyl-5-hydroxy-6-metoxy-1,4-benzoquinol methylase